MKINFSCRFNFEEYPELFEKYYNYKVLQKKAAKLSTKESDSSVSKYDKIAEERDEYSKNVLAKAIYNVFDPIKPILHNRRRGGDFQWTEVFDKPFEDLAINQRKYLIGLIDGDYVYELPSEYYND